MYISKHTLIKMRKPWWLISKGCIKTYSNESHKFFTSLFKKKKVRFFGEIPMRNELGFLLFYKVQYYNINNKILIVKVNVAFCMYTSLYHHYYAHLKMLWMKINFELIKLDTPGVKHFKAVDLPYQNEV